ncbi:hypothetical protein EW146_g7587 [Bondarzewia mesenterica]|uniref:AAA+ ATPase domain-containing protein n=1 Tax=Bondarzewia mesenterica TaxID=1095465 RepID=A0A4S4LM87_9AGAM|nr:hypothetical protein EW146_g7587 [Bondarzewia mesenterica]
MAPDDLQRLEALLTKFRDEPVDSGGNVDTILPPILKFLMSSPPDSDGSFHWFCHRASPLTLEAGTFLLRLFAYDNNRVEEWKARLQSILELCHLCVQGLQVAKMNSQQTYLSAFPEDMITFFFSNFNEWELGVVFDALISGPSSSHTKKDPLSVMSVALYHCVDNLHIVGDERILSRIGSRIPPSSFADWPSGPPPPGLLYLLVHEDENLRRWAKSQISLCQPMIISDSKDVALANYITAFQTAIFALGPDSEERTSNTRRSSKQPYRDLAIGADTFPFTKDPAVLWSGFSNALRFFPQEFLKPGKYTDVDIRRIIAGHLHDVGPQFIEVLHCLLFLLKRLGGDLWEGDGPDYPEVVFDSIKDNPAFSEYLRTVGDKEERPWFLYWFADFLATIWSSSIFGNVLAKMVDFLCEELQHERFKDPRSTIMVAAVSLFRKTLRKCEGDQAQAHLTDVLNALDIHVDRLTNFAFAPLYADAKWEKARAACRDLVLHTLHSDVQDLSNSITSLCQDFANTRKETKPTIILPRVPKPMWKKVYDGVQANDADGVAMIISAVARSAHLDILSLKAFGVKEKSQSSPTSARVAIERVNACLRTFREGFLETISKYTNHSPSSTIKELLCRPAVTKDVMFLMFCPDEDVQLAAQTLVGQAFDVDIRSDCFRALLEHLPHSFPGICDFIDKFLEYAPIAPEACGLSKVLVRCLTDVIEVLCSSTGGLLHEDRFLTRSTADLPKFWTLMTKAIAVIFRKTPVWSTYFDSGDMIIWMRDALIFGRDMLAQWRVFEGAAVEGSEASSSSTSRRKRSIIGKKIVDDLQRVLPELARWLRLTDEELLHQSFALLQSLLDCFRETHIQPSADAIAKLHRFIETARKPGRDRPQSRLDSRRVSKLEDTLSAFQEEDEIQIVSHAPTPESVLAKSKVKPTVEPGIKKSRKPSPANSKSSFISTSSSVALSKSSKSTSSWYFNKQDQKKLDASTTLPPMPKFNRSVFPKRDGIQMKERGKPSVSSSAGEESSDEGSGEEGRITDLRDMQRVPKAKKTPAERRQIKLIEVPTTGKTAALERIRKAEAAQDARRIAFRLKPDVTALHRTLLSWPYDHSGPDPPSIGEKPRLAHVPDNFTDYNHYRRTFEPLLLLECWAQILQSKEEPKEIYECKIASRSFVDDWLNVDILITEPLKKGWFLTDTDVVLLQHTATNKSILGKAEKFRTTPFGVQAVQVAIRCFLGSGVDPGLQVNSTWRISKVLSLSTLHREYGALVAMPCYDHADFFLRPQLSKKPYVDDKEIQQTMAKYNVNEPQAVAIASSMRTEGFTLIQGPPGTGKTSTICGLVQSFLASRPRPTTAINAGRAPGPVDKSQSKKILLCAPSNAAIDELAYRVKEGISGSGRMLIAPKVVRVGADKAINLSVKDISLDYLVDQKLDTAPDSKKPKDSNSEILGLRTELESIRVSRQQKHKEAEEIRGNTAKSLALQDEINKLSARYRTLQQRVNQMRDQQKSDDRTLDATRRRFRAEVLQEADVICSTLSGAGHELLEMLDFDMIIIDEAAQAIELNPQQLPPTVISQEASKYSYNQSLFVRLQKQQPDVVHLLSIQYRMHPDISRLPSQVFYHGRLLDGPGMAEKTKRVWHNSPRFGTYRFFNVSEGLESQGPSHSILNKSEVQVAVALYSRLLKEHSSIDFDFKVGVVSMYRAQITAIRSAFVQRFGADIVGKVDFHTVDGFQGQEKDIIILSCVRAGPGLQNVGFLADVRRMNVALTRARASLFVLGHSPTLERSDEMWKKIVVDARSRSCLTDVNVQYFTSPGTALLPSRPPPVIKPLKAAVPPVPTDLATPQELKASIARKPSSENRVDFVESTSAGPETEQLPPPVALEPGDSDTPVGQKRTRPEDDGKNTPHEASLSKPKPRPPPVKRQKQAPNIFIPKKRPAQDNVEGPPQKKQA